LNLPQPVNRLRGVTMYRGRAALSTFFTPGNTTSNPSVGVTCLARTYANAKSRSSDPASLQPVPDRREQPSPFQFFPARGTPALRARPGQTHPVIYRTAHEFARPTVPLRPLQLSWNALSLKRPLTATGAFRSIAPVVCGAEDQFSVTRPTSTESAGRKSSLCQNLLVVWDLRMTV
jgi:hypothetical protein